LAPAAASSKTQVLDAASAEELLREKRKVSMYEDLTNLTVVKVELLNGQETQWHCVYTADQRSTFSGHAVAPLCLAAAQLTCHQYIPATGLSFSIRQALAPAGEVMYYVPKDLALETDKAFVEKLAFLAGEFTIRWDQVGGFWREMQARMEEEGADEEDEEMDE